MINTIELFRVPNSSSTSPMHRPHKAQLELHSLIQKLDRDKGRTKVAAELCHCVRRLRRSEDLSLALGAIERIFYDSSVTRQFLPRQLTLKVDLELLAQCVLTYLAAIELDCYVLAKNSSNRYGFQFYLLLEGLVLRLRDSSKGNMEAFTVAYTAHLQKMKFFAQKPRSFFHKRFYFFFLLLHRLYESLDRPDEGLELLRDVLLQSHALFTETQFLLIFLRVARSLLRPDPPPERRARLALQILLRLLTLLPPALPFLRFLARLTARLVFRFGFDLWKQFLQRLYAAGGLLLCEELSSLCKGVAPLSPESILDLSQLQMDWQLRFFDDHDSFKIVVQGEVIKAKQLRDFFENEVNVQPPLQAGAVTILGELLLNHPPAAAYLDRSNLLAVFTQLIESATAQDIPLAVLEVAYALVGRQLNDFGNSHARLAQLLQALHTRFPGLSHPRFLERLGALLGAVINHSVGVGGAGNPYAGPEELAEIILQWKPQLIRPKVLLSFILSLLPPSEAAALGHTRALLRAVYYSEKSRSLQNALVATLRKCYEQAGTADVRTLIEEQALQFVVDDIPVTQVESFHVNVQKLRLLRVILLRSERPEVCGKVVAALESITSSHFGLGSAEELRMRALQTLIEGCRLFATRYDAICKPHLEQVMGALGRALSRASLRVQLQVLGFFETFRVNKHGQLSLGNLFTAVRASPQPDRGRQPSVVDRSFEEEYSYTRHSHSLPAIQERLLTAYETFAVEKTMEFDDTNFRPGGSMEGGRRKTERLEIGADLGVLTPAIVSMTQAAQKTSSALLVEGCFRVLGSWLQFFFAFEKLVLRNLAELAETVAHRVFLKQEAPLSDEPLSVISEILQFTQTLLTVATAQTHPELGVVARLLELPVQVLKKASKVKQFRRQKEVNQRGCHLLASLCIQAFLVSASLLPPQLRAHRDAYDLKAVLAQFLECLKGEAFLRHDPDLAFVGLHCLLLFQQSPYGLAFNSRSKMDLIRVALALASCGAPRPQKPPRPLVWKQITAPQSYTHCDDALYLLAILGFLDLKVGEDPAGLQELYLYLKQKSEAMLAAGEKKQVLAKMLLQTLLFYYFGSFTAQPPMPPEPSGAPRALFLMDYSLVQLHSGQGGAFELKVFGPAYNLYQSTQVSNGMLKCSFRPPSIDLSPHFILRSQFPIFHSLLDSRDPYILEVTSSHLELLHQLPYTRRVLAETPVRHAYSFLILYAPEEGSPELPELLSHRLPDPQSFQFHFFLDCLRGLGDHLNRAPEQRPACPIFRGTPTGKHILHFTDEARDILWEVPCLWDAASVENGLYLKELAFQNSQVLVLWQCPAQLTLELGKACKSPKVLVIVHPLSSLVAHIFLRPLGAAALPHSIRLFARGRRMFVPLKLLPSFLRQLCVLADSALGLHKSPDARSHKHGRWNQLIHLRRLAGTRKLLD